MRHHGVLLIGAVLAAACASNPTPPAASSQTVAQASSSPNPGPDFTPASNDGQAGVPSHTRRVRDETGPAQPLSPTPEATANGSTNAPADATSNTSNADRAANWRNSTEGSGNANPTTGNAAAAPSDLRDQTGSLTPMDQGPSPADRRLTQQIRQEVMNDKTLSFTAKNVKIITLNGKVTLRGQVKSEAERTAIEAAARKIAGSGTLVESRLELIK